MAEKGDRLDHILMTIMSATIGVIMLCSFAIPTITGSAGIGALVGDNATKYGPLLGVVVIILIIGLIIPIIRGYNAKQR